jgi:hypothetical protein
MRPEPNNDIDLLLRQLTRRSGAPVSEFDEQHLDADELNSYVANALPAAARARYTDHLADCSSCRKLVTQLSAAQGPVPSEQRAGVIAPSGLKSFLASLFSPLVLRYAVPALGLIIVAAVGFIVLRDRQNRESVASLRAEEPNSVAATRPQEQTTPSGEFASDSNTAQPLVQKPEPARTETAPTATARAEAKAPVVAKKLADSETAAAAEPPPAAPKAASTEEAKQSEDLQKQKKADVAEQAPVRGVADREDRPSKNEARDTTPQASVTVTPGGTAQRNYEIRSGKTGEANSAGGVQSFKRTPAEKEADKDTSLNLATATRSLAGRRFRKSGSVWIDTEYESSTPTTNITRGSEQYRALIADEPSLRTIAETLDGEIIVVWKSRAYRIR